MRSLIKAIARIWNAFCEMDSRTAMRPNQNPTRK